jgi:MSHA biogenesis protein MshN
MAGGRVHRLLEHRLGDAAMSLINKMLRDLDKRNAPQGGLADGRASNLSQHIRPVAPRKVGSELFWISIAVLMLIAVAWVGWVVWQMMPRPLATELAYQSSRGKIDAPKDAAPQSNPPTVAVVAAPPVATPATPAPGAPSAGPASSTLPAPLQTSPATEPAKIDMLRLATELTTPIPKGRAVTRSNGAAKKSAKQVSAQAVATQSGSVINPSRIDRHSNSTQQDRAEDEFRRAVNLVNQGRVAEGMDGLKKALATDPGHESARLTLVALLLEAKRSDEAAAALQEGLALNAENTGFAMLLARIMVERKDIPGALALLQKHAAQPDRDPAFHAFAAALYQRLGRHKEAIEQYQAALRLAPSAGVWWLGLGISFAATDQSKNAVEAFKNAKAAGNLAPDLVAYVDQKLQQLQ